MFATASPPFAVIVGMGSAPSAGGLEMQGRRRPTRREQEEHRQTGDGPPSSLRRYSGPSTSQGCPLDPGPERINHRPHQGRLRGAALDPTTVTMAVTAGLVVSIP